MLKISFNARAKRPSKSNHVEIDFSQSNDANINRTSRLNAKEAGCQKNTGYILRRMKSALFDALFSDKSGTCNDQACVAMVMSSSHSSSTQKSNTHKHTSRME